MTLREYYNELTLFIRDNPEIMDLKAVYAQDPEGNHYYEVESGDLLTGLFEDGELTSKECQDDDGDEYETIVNAVSIN